MTEHPITPPSWLRRQWIKEWQDLRPSFTTLEQWLAKKAARWGADQELEACDKALREIWQMDHVSTLDDFLRELRAARRPKPKSQADNALEALDSFEGFTGSLQEIDVIRAALERLRELEQSNG